MGISEKLYYMAETSQTTYGSTPTNHLNIERLIEHKDAWKKAEALYVKKNKNLVLYAPQVAKWDINKLVVLAMRLDALKKQGFKLYIYQKGKIKDFEISSLINPAQVFDQEELSDKFISSKAVAQLDGISRDQLLLMDHKQLNELIQGDKEDCAAIGKSTVADLTESNLSLGTLKTLLEQKGQTLKTLRLSGCINLAGGEISNNLRMPELSELRLGALSENTYIEIDGVSIGYLRACELTLESVNSLINSTDKLTYLDLSWRNDHKTLDSDVLNLIKMPALMEVLILKGCKITEQSLASFLDKAQQLKVLDLEEALTSTEGLISRLSDDLISRLNGAFLEDLNLKCSHPQRKLSDATLAKLLGQATRLKKLNLEGCCLYSENELGSIHLSSLEELNLSGCDISESLVAKIISKAEHLKKINIVNCSGVTANTFKHLNFSSLEELAIGSSYTLCSTDLASMLARAPKLRKLDLSSNNGLTDEITDNFRLDALEELNLTNTSISLSSLVKILSKAPNLKVLNISGCTNLDGELFADLDLPLLEYLNTEESNITVESFHKISAHTSYLKSLKLDGIEFTSFVKNPPSPKVSLNSSTELILDTEYILDPKIKPMIITQFKYIKSLKINGNDLTIDSLNPSSLEEFSIDSFSVEPCDSRIFTLLSKASKLKVLRISKLQFSDDLISSNPLDLGLLEAVSFANSEISMKALSTIIGKSAHIKSLTLSNCKELGSANIDSLNLDSLESLDLSDTKIDDDLLTQILTKAKQLTELRLSNCRISDKNAELLNKMAINKLVLIGCTTNPKFADKLLSSSVNESDLVDQSYRPMFNNLNLNINADTDPKNSKSFHVDKIFYSYDAAKDPSVHHYRVNVFDKLSVNTAPCTVNDAFTLSNSEESLQFENDKKLPKKSTRDTYNSYLRLPHLPEQKNSYFYGKHKLSLSKKWQALPSLSPNETMLEYHVSDPNAELEIRYSQRDNLYYVRSNFEQEIVIDFSLEVASSDKKQLPTDVINKIMECRAFKAAACPQLKSGMTGLDYLNAIETNKVGSCRHRAVVLKQWMKKFHPDIPVRIVNNACHIYIELFYENQWNTIDLGGYEAKLHIKEPHPPNGIKAKVSSAELSADGIVIVPQPKKSYFSLLKSKEVPKSSTQYLQKLFASGDKKQLIKLDSPEAVNSLRFGLEEYCQNTKRPCFYVHSPKDLLCMSAYIKNKGTQGVMHKGPGGPLYDFLKKHKDGKPLIIVNYDKFTVNDIVKFNTLLDIERKADGVELPKESMVIGLIDDTKPGAYDGRDFYSRFDTEPENCRFDKEEFYQNISIPQTKASIKDPYVIELYGGSNWREDLLGHWQLSGETLNFVEGELFKAIQSQKPIVLQNGPNDDKDFNLFWQEVLSKKEFKTQIGKHPLPTGFELSQREGYPWTEFAKYLTLSTAIEPDSLVLNSSLFPHFLAQYTCDNATKTIELGKGLLEQHRGKTVPIYLSAPLSPDSWARFLATCAHYNVKVNLTCAAGVNLPEDLNKSDLTLALQQSPWEGSAPSLGDYCVSSNDIDFTLTQIEADLVIDVSELDVGNLLQKVQADFNEADLKFSFTEKEGALLTALAAGKTVILKGDFKPDMNDQLQELIVKRMHTKKPHGRLILVSNEDNLAAQLPSFKHQVTADNKKRYLEPLCNELFSDADYEIHSLTQLVAMLVHHDLNPNSDMTKAWQGMENLPKNSIPQSMSQRMDIVTRALKKSPYVFIAGKTGVGKTTFVQELWRKQQPALHVGVNALEAWAMDTRPGLKTLFIDEANISQRQWSEFEGLFQKPRGIMINNTFYPLSEDHKVLFAGNPISYGGERQLPSLFKRHGNSVLFETLPLDYIQQEIIDPVFVNRQSMESGMILKVAQFLATCNSDKVLISPRELSMMALLSLSYCHNNPAANPQEVVNYYAYTLAKDLVPAEHRDSFASLWSEIPQLARSRTNYPVNFRINKSNQPAVEALSDALDLRALRQTPGNEHIARGGLGGIIIEGEPGIGKSELVAKTLLAHKIRKGALDKTHPDEQVYYEIPVGMDLTEKKSVLLKAFYEGAVVVIEEINSAPMMEGLLNDLLMGLAPEGSNIIKPGFMIIGTQNPATMAGRMRISQALQRRLQTVVIPEYGKEDMIQILLDKGLTPKNASELVEEYLFLNSNIPPSSEVDRLCFRDVVNCAKAIVRAKESSTYIKDLEEDDFFEVESPFDLIKKQLNDYINQPKQGWFDFFSTSNAFEKIAVENFIRALNGDSSFLTKRDLDLLKKGDLGMLITNYIKSHNTLLSSYLGTSLIENLDKLVESLVVDYQKRFQK